MLSACRTAVAKSATAVIREDSGNSEPVIQNPAGGEERQVAAAATAAKY